MSYLTLRAGLPDFSKAVISLWFRVPRESVIAASGTAIGDPFFPMMQGILPLVTFGRPQTKQNYDALNHEIWTYNESPDHTPAPISYPTIYFVKGKSVAIDPSYIGLTCQENGTMYLIFNLQTDRYMTSLSASNHEVISLAFWSGSDPNYPTADVPGAERPLGSGVFGWFPYVGQADIKDRSDTDIGQPEYFTVDTNVVLEPDQWHHLLLSFDIGGVVSIGTPFASSACRLWYAIDDVDYRGAENMAPYRDTGGQWGHDTLDPNAIMTRTAWYFSGGDPEWEAANYYYNRYTGLPTGSFGGGSIPSDGADMGLPASLKYVDAILRCEMAEFQMWTGVTLDTGITSNRRAFVDEDGEPVSPTEGIADDPTPPAEKLLGKKPDILLHGSSDWESGHNTGTIGIMVDDEGNETDIASGQFQPTAKIEPFEPDPSLKETPTA